MKKDSLRQAVASVKWTDEQRRTIEARLSVPLHHPEDIEDGYTDSVTAISRVLPREGNEMKTKTKKSRKKIWVIAAIAAALSVGGVTAGVAMRGRNPNGETVSQNETLPNTENSNTPELEELKGKINLRFTNDKYEPSEYNCSLIYGNCFWLTRSETGWYLNAQLRPDKNSDIVYGIHYHDDSSGQTVPLCARPQCKHDGNEYCVATQTTYEHTNLVYYNGYLYSVAFQPSNAHFVLLRYAPDGTEIKVLADFGQSYQTFGQFYQTLNSTQIYRGNIIIKAPLTNGEFLNQYGNQETTKGFKFIAYEIATGKQTEIFSCMPEKDSAEAWTPGQLFWCAEDSIIMLQNDRMNTKIITGIYKISMTTGELERIANGNASICAVSNTKVLYSKKPNGFAYTENLFLYDIKTKQETELTTISSAYDPIYNKFAMDDTYIYHVQTEPETNNTTLTVYDLQFNVLRTAPFAEHKNCYGLIVRGGMIYCFEPDMWQDPTKTEEVTIKDVNGNDITIESPVTHYMDGYITCCDVKDFIAGTGTLQPLFVYMDNPCPDETPQE